MKYTVKRFKQGETHEQLRGSMAHRMWLDGSVTSTFYAVVDEDGIIHEGDCYQQKYIAQFTADHLNGVEVE